jgi:hypothetical protein
MTRVAAIQGRLRLLQPLRRELAHQSNSSDMHIGATISGGGGDGERDVHIQTVGNAESCLDIADKRCAVDGPRRDAKTRRKSPCQSCRTFYGHVDQRDI